MVQFVLLLKIQIILGYEVLRRTRDLFEMLLFLIEGWNPTKLKGRPTGEGRYLEYF